VKFVLLGCVVTMDAASTVLPNGAIYVDGNTIVAATDRAAPVPPDFAGAASIDTDGFIYPGLIELHNHLSYDALPLWDVPKRFSNRSQWQSNRDYVAHVSAPMDTIAKSIDPNLLAALVRYVETKCLLGGVTTTQGVSLKGDHLETCYRSAMRVVDDPADAKFPRAVARIPIIAAADWESFKRELDTASCLLLHLSEGLDAQARDAFLSLKKGGHWAVGPALAGIDCAALQREDFAVMAAKGASMVWSPLNNLLLYGGTADVKAARREGVPVALGSHWSPSGSKNLLNGLKVAKVVNGVNGLGISDLSLVASVTSAPAAVVKWDKLIGSISAGKRADFTVIAASPGADPYDRLIAAAETDIVLVVIEGRPVVGTPALMSALGQTGETLCVGAEQRVINYGPGDPRIPSLTFAQAEAALSDALKRLPTLLGDEHAGHGVTGRMAEAPAPRLRLALDREHQSGCALRARLRFAGEPAGPDAEPALAPAMRAAAAPLPLKPLKLDAPSVADDPEYGSRLQQAINIPPAIKDGLKSFYR
jgi:5-methylthioadenosine/S-adenosylhomocysteine deaminase